MSKTTEKQRKNNGGCTGKGFKPGQSGNPAGRPTLENTFSVIARELLLANEINITYKYPKDGRMVQSTMHMESDKTINHSLIAALIKEGMSGNVQAIKELIDRVQGKSTENINQNHTLVNNRVVIKNMAGKTIEVIGQPDDK
jgi:hypothetical protein